MEYLDSSQKMASFNKKASIEEYRKKYPAEFELLALYDNHKDSLLKHSNPFGEEDDYLDINLENLEDQYTSR